MRTMGGTVIRLFTALAILLLAGNVSAVSYWKDDFNYTNLTEMETSGWLIGLKDYTQVGSGNVTLDNDGSFGTLIRYSNFPSGIYEWKAEAKGMWIGRSYGSLGIIGVTERHDYSWAGDGYYSEFILYRDGVIVLRFPGYSPSLNQWYTFALERQGNTFYMYLNGELKNTYVEIDTQPSALKGIGTNAGWISTDKYDYVSVSGEVSNSIGYSALVATGQNTFVQSSNGSFGLIPRGYSKTLNNSVVLNNTGDISARVEARFNDSIAGVYGLVSGANVLNATNFALGIPSVLIPFNNSGADVQVAVAPPGATALDARLGVPADAVAGDYSGTVILTFSNNV